MGENPCALSDGCTAKITPRAGVFLKGWLHSKGIGKIYKIFLMYVICLIL